MHSWFGLRMLVSAVLVCGAMGICAPLLAQPLKGLNEAERAWLASHPVIRIAVDPDWRPLEYVEDGRAKGLSVAYLDKVTHRLGVRVELVPTQSWSESVQKLRQGEADLLPAMPDFQVPLDAESHVALSRPYYVGMTLIVAGTHHANFFDVRDIGCGTVALKSGGAYDHWMRKHAPVCARILAMPSDAAALQAVANGDAVAAIGPDAIMHPIIRLRHDRTLHIAGTIAELPLVLRMGVRNDSVVLLGILNKALASIDVQESDQVYRDWVEQADYGEPTVTALFRYYGKSIATLVAIFICLSLAVYHSRRARLAAQQGEQAKAEFLAIMSHEIRTPLNALLATIELLTHRPGPDKQAALLQQARESADLLLTLLNNALDHSRLEAGAISLEYLPTDISALANSALTVVRTEARRKGLELSLQDEANGQTVRIDPTRVRQILINLLSNAIKFTEHGYVTLRVTLTRPEAADNALLTLSVTDTGIGISSADQTQLFKPFTQAERSISRRFGGTGLGLSICRKLVQAMDGDIGLQSTVGKGTEVTVSLPVQIVDPVESDVPLDSGTVDLVPAAPHRPRILVIEDNVANQMVLTDQLTMLGYETVMADNGEQAMQAFDADSYAAILMDCHLAGTTGYAIAEKMRGRERARGTPPAPIIAISADTSAEHTANCLAAGMDGILAKPIRLPRLRETLNLWVPSAQAVQGSIEDGVTDASALASLRSMMSESLHAEHAALKDAVATRQPQRFQHHLHRLKGVALIGDNAALVDAVQRCEALVAAQAGWQEIDQGWGAVELALRDALQEIEQATQA